MFNMQVRRHIPFAFLGFVAILLAGLLGACAQVSLFSFSGTSLNPEVKTISIQTVENEAGNGPPSLSINFTEKLKDYYIRNTKLNLVQSEGDMQIDAVIRGYEVTPIAPTGDQIAGLQRLTITLSVNYYNAYDEQASFENKSFSQFEDFPPDRNLADVENDLIRVISDRIIFDIFNATAGNW
jgi:hypothetical protein